MLDKLPFIRILSAAILGSFILGGIFVALLYYRIGQLSNANYTPCQNLPEAELPDCYAQITYDFITNGQWTSLIAVALILVATLIGFITGRNSRALVVSPLTGLICGVVLLNIVEPGGRLVALVTFLGFSLGGLIAHRQARLQNDTQP
ncbi:hypothetical protein [Sedimenticola thiotaurini]|uniref:Uncharacterized protein n=1 Tax=Sedimenticola thiotaurini TaxID=1543721 RepID=A0A0F7JYB1_9GAMM|nr:hypothetical protein [Sedimenticola thiotaurini]AKH20727.1 hypothetical protein AAY24_10580 [Sedimenticola thiotaurini]